MKPLARVSVRASVWFARIVTATVTAFGSSEVGAVVRGVVTTMRELLTDWTTPGIPSKVTRTGSLKPPPLIVTFVPPSAEPWLGSTELTKNSAALRNSTVPLPATVPNTARSVAIPAVPPGNRKAVAWPFTRSRVVEAPPLMLPKPPRVVVNVTCDPLAGTAPSERVTRTVTVAGVGESRGSDEGEAVTDTVVETIGVGG